MRTRTPVTAPSTYRLLVLDDEPSVHEGVADDLAPLVDAGRLHIRHALTEQEAEEAYTTSFVDLILLDLDIKGRRMGGAEFHSALEDMDAVCDVIVYTKVDAQTHARRVIDMAVGPGQARVVDFFDKVNEKAAAFDAVRERVEAHEGSAIEIENLDLAVELLGSRRDRYPTSGPGFLRADDGEVATELHRLCQQLFARTSVGERSSAVRVELRPLPRRGWSAAITLNPIVQMRLADVDSTAPGYECVLKVGPVDDLTEEVARYDEFVRYGVKLEQRVELLGFARQDGLAAIVYSFAGGVYGDTLSSLDELLREAPTDDGAEVVRILFASSNWYSVHAGRKRIGDHFGRVYRTDPESALKTNLEIWQKLAQDERRGRRGGERLPRIEVERDSADGETRLEIGEAPALRLPSASFFGEGWTLQSHPQCLIHGDMHGGNVMVELADEARGGDGAVGPHIRRVCLIDYRNAGPGPRCVDAAALEGSVRIADADGMLARFGPDGPNAEEHRALLVEAARRVDPERQLHDTLWGRRKQAPRGAWAELSREVVAGVRRSFPGDEPEVLEYMQTCLFYTVRQLRYRMHHVVRARLCAWLAAQYRTFRDLYPRP